MSLGCQEVGVPGSRLPISENEAFSHLLFKQSEVEFVPYIKMKILGIRNKREYVVVLLLLSSSSTSSSSGIKVFIN